MSGNAKTRGGPYSDEELKVLADACLENKAAISNTSQSAAVSKERKSAWDVIQKKVLSVSMEHRTIGQLQQKWSDMKSKTKKKAAQMRGEMRVTGGGPPPAELSELEAKVVEGIGKVAVTGIQHGVDTHSKSKSDDLKAVKPEPMRDATTSRAETSERAAKRLLSENVKEEDKVTFEDEEMAKPVLSSRVPKRRKVGKSNEESESDKYRDGIMEMKAHEHEMKMKVLKLKERYYEMKVQKLAEKSYTVTDLDTGELQISSPFYPKP